MAAINDLISQIQDETLRNRIQEEVSKMAKQKKFGLVFEEHCQKARLSMICLSKEDVMLCVVTARTTNPSMLC